MRSVKIPSIFHSRTSTDPGVIFRSRPSSTSDIAMSQPIPLICIGRHREIALAIEKQIGSNFTYSAIMTSYNNDTLTALLETLNPPPRGIIIGKVIGVEYNPEFGTRRANIFPAVQTGDLREVFVLK